MPFRIIRNDITKVKADIIVNTANPKPTYGYGTDSAIFYAAGKEQLLAARKEIGCINFGDIAVTSAFSLKAKYIIHTVGPVWIDGNNNEFVTLKSCYEKSLKKAIELKAESIAFPLIATGVYGFPKDKALQIAISVFSEFLVNNDIEIILVVYDKKAYELSNNIMGDIESFIDNNYVQEERMLARCMSDSTLVISSIERRQFLNQEKPALVSNNEIQPYDSLFSSDDSFTDAGESFHKKLFELIAQAGLDNKEVYKRSNLDRKHFSKIQCDENYHPKKKTVMALCIGLQLDLTQAIDLMARADWAFSPSSKMDLIVQKAIKDKQYDIMQLNMVLFKYTSETLGI